MDKLVKAFVSYSWENQEMVNKVVDLCTRLRRDSVDVQLDRWHLREGQDKYVFMESMVNDEAIERVLLACDKSYTRKANMRTGGVGDETAIISSEVYGRVNQDKFIPLVFEKNDDGTPCLPAYIKTRIYIDLSDEYTYEDNYEKLIRNIFRMPKEKLPPLGVFPEWINMDSVSVGALKAIIKAIHNTKPENEAKMNVLILQMNEATLEALEEIRLKDDTNDVSLIDNFISRSLPVRNTFVDFFSALFCSGVHDVDYYLVEFFSNCWNLLMRTMNNIVHEAHHFFLWEMLLCIVNTLFYHGKYSELHKFVTSTFFVSNISNYQDEQRPNFIQDLRPYFQIIDREYMLYKGKKNRLSMASDILIEREYLPMIKKRSLVLSDLLIMQITMSCSNLKYGWPWFPLSYIYQGNSQPEYQKLISRRYCERFMAILGVHSIDEFKRLISPNDKYEKIRYNEDFFHRANFIIDEISIDKIASMP